MCFIIIKGKGNENMKINRLFLLLLTLTLSGCSLFKNESNNNNNNSSNNTQDNSSTNNSSSNNDTGNSTNNENGSNNNEDDEPVEEARMQDTPILHCWNWSMNNISNNLQNIKDAGFKTIQLSPMQPQKDYYGNESISSTWWKLYQPLGFSVATGNHVLGTKSELTAMCSKAKSLGIDVIVDVVSNHLAGGNKTQLNGAVQGYESAIYSQNLIHTTQLGIDDNNVKSIVQGQMGDFPDLQTENSTVQNRVLSLLKEYLDCGVNGFRFDAAKHIETPDDGQYASNYWPTILNGATSYAKSKGLDEPYYYGEILYTCGVGRKFSSYTKYMSVIDSKQGSDVLMAVKDKNLDKISQTYNSGVAGNKLVLWGESHDTYANNDGETKNVSQDIINKAYVIQTSRKDASSLYLARPNSMGDRIGDVGSTTYKNAEIKAVNKFHNAFVGKSESVSVINGCFVNVRGNNGAAIVGLNNSSSIVSMTISGLAAGSYVDLVNNKKYEIGSSSTSINLTNGVAVLVSEAKANTINNTNNNQQGGNNQPATNVTYTLTNSNGWDVFVDNAKVYSYVSGGNYGSGQWIICTRMSNTSLSFVCDSSATTCKIVRFQPSVSTPDWSAAIWNQSSEIALGGSTSINYSIG